MLSFRNRTFVHLKYLSTYWARFRALYPGHEIFEKLTPQQLATTLPIKLHGDEGRSGLSGCVLCRVRKLHLKVLQLVFFSLVVSKFEGKKKKSYNATGLATGVGQRNPKID